MMVNNEKGSSLLVVLLVMTVFTIVGLGLMGLNVNTSKQVSKTGNDLQATNLAEMGAYHLKGEVLRILASDNYKNKNFTDFKTNLQFDLNKLKEDSFKINEINNSQYRFDEVIVSTEEVGNNEIVQTRFTSVGTPENQKEKSISGTIKATRSKAYVFPDLKEPAVNKITTQVEDILESLKSKPIYLEQGLKMVSNNRVIDLKYDLYSKGIINQQKNKTTLRVLANNGKESNAHITEITQKESGQEALMCVEGTLYIYNSKPSDFEENYHIVKDLVCDKTASKSDGYNGVYARNIIFKDRSNWDKNNIEIIDVEYK